MARRVALDTGVLIALEKLGPAQDGILQPDDDVGLSPIVLAEYRVGIACAQLEYQPRMKLFLTRFLHSATLLPYDDKVLEEHVRLLIWTRRHGLPRGQHDLIIAATAAATGRTLVTFDKRAHFDELPGVDAQVLG